MWPQVSQQTNRLFIEFGEPSSAFTGKRNRYSYSCLSAFLPEARQQQPSASSLPKWTITRPVGRLTLILHPWAVIALWYDFCFMRQSQELCTKLCKKWEKYGLIVLPKGVWTGRAGCYRIHTCDFLSPDRFYLFIHSNLQPLIMWSSFQVKLICTPWSLKACYTRTMEKWSSQKMS